MWDETHSQNCITINWDNSKDLSRLSEDALGKLVGPQNLRQVWDFVHEVKPGDTVVANQGNSGVVGIGVVESGYLPPTSEKNPRKHAKDHRHAHLVNWEIDTLLDVGSEFFGRVPRTVMRLDSETCRKLKKAYLKQNTNLKEKLDRLLPDDDKQQARSNAEGTMRELLKQIGQVIVYGPPGTGKTREAKRIALSVLNDEDLAPEASEEEVEKELLRFRDEGRFGIVVFHPSYEYEQFVGGIGPAVDGSNLRFEAKAGPFLRLCRKAEGGKSPVVLIIDEINRGLLPKLLGELIYALEYRGHRVTLPICCDGRDDLIVPRNLYIIATMNSSDRSIGHIDVAIRRRFGLYPLEPQSAVVRSVWKSVGDETYGAKLAALMDRLNENLGSRRDVGAGTLGVGQSYFLPTQVSSAKPGRQQLEAAKQQVKLKWKYQVIPLLREYDQLLPGDDSLQEYFSRSLEECLI